MPIPEAAIYYLAHLRSLEAAYQRSGANSENVLTIAKPGETKALVLASASAFYSDQQAQDVTIAYTDRAGNSKSIVIRTGASEDLAFPLADVGGVVTKANTAVVVTAPAGGSGETSDIRLNWATSRNGCSTNWANSLTR